jgi:hypothetical protein
MKPNGGLGRRALFIPSPADGVKHRQGKSDTDAFKAVSAIEHGFLNHDLNLI